MRKQATKLALLWPIVVSSFDAALSRGFGTTVNYCSQPWRSFPSACWLRVLLQRLVIRTRPNFRKLKNGCCLQGAAESIAPELAAILGLGSDRLPVKLKSYRASDGVSIAFAVSTNPGQKGIVLSALKTMADKMEIYSVGTAWLPDRSGTLRRTIAVDASGAKVVPDSSRASQFKNIKAFFFKKLQDTSSNAASSPSPRTSATAAGGKKGTK